MRLFAARPICSPITALSVLALFLLVPSPSWGAERILYGGVGEIPPACPPSSCPCSGDKSGRFYIDYSYTANSGTASAAKGITPCLPGARVQYYFISRPTGRDVAINTIRLTHSQREVDVFQSYADGRVIYPQEGLAWTFPFAGQDPAGSWIMTPRVVFLSSSSTLQFTLYVQWEIPPPPPPPPPPDADPWWLVRYKKPFPIPPDQCGVIVANQGLAKGEGVWSCDRRFVLVLQTDGNLVYYFVPPVGGWQPLWASNTFPTGDYWAILKPWGPFGVWNALPNPYCINGTCYTASPDEFFVGSEIWSAYRFSNFPTFEVQDDGNLVLYSSSRAVLWASNTNQSYCRFLSDPCADPYCKPLYQCLPATCDWCTPADCGHCPAGTYCDGQKGPPGCGYCFCSQ